MKICSVVHKSLHVDRDRQTDKQRLHCKSVKYQVYYRVESVEEIYT